MSTLTSYEQTFGVRQLNWYMYPNNDFGFNYPYNGTINSAGADSASFTSARSEEHTSELQSRLHLVCRLLLEKKKPILRFPRIGQRSSEGNRQCSRVLV